MSLVLVEDVHCRILLHVSYDCEEGDKAPEEESTRMPHPIFSLVLVNPGTVQGILANQKVLFLSPNQYDPRSRCSPFSLTMLIDGSNPGYIILFCTTSQVYSLECYTQWTHPSYRSRGRKRGTTTWPFSSYFWQSSSEHSSSSQSRSTCSCEAFPSHRASSASKKNRQNKPRLWI